MTQKTTGFTADKILSFLVLLITAVLFLPLFFRHQFRELLAVSLLGLFYSIFLINLWQRWTAPVRRLSRKLLPKPLRRTTRFVFETVIPLRSWGVVPCIIQVFLLGCLIVFGWLLTPLYYETVRNPAIQGWIRSLFQTTAPEAYNFLNDLIFNPNPYAVLAANTREIFGSLNRFFSTFILPLAFILSSGLGALLHRQIEKLFARAEGRNSRQSKIIRSYSQLFERYLLYNSIYYFLLGIVISTVFIVLNSFGITQFENKIIVGLMLSFFLGNLVVPGLGTIILTILTIGLLTIWQGVYGGVITAAIFIFYFFSDDYLIKPYFLNWLGSGLSSDWDFGLEVLIIGLIILYASFGLIGTLILFPGLCFLNAYLRHLHPEIKPWVLSPVKTVSNLDN